MSIQIERLTTAFMALLEADNEEEALTREGAAGHSSFSQTPREHAFKEYACLASEATCHHSLVPVLPSRPRGPVRLLANHRVCTETHLDTPPKPFHHIAHYYADNVSIATLCSVHGWTIRLHPRRVYDAVIFNNELDLLKLRWRELASVITKFVISSLTPPSQVKESHSGLRRVCKGLRLLNHKWSMQKWEAGT
ncbi:hypothetical protein L7F22_021495 [Adiantum nelumboides]|nr:hypothetical protein [Adiantum nelumboides]